MRESRIMLVCKNMDLYSFQNFVDKFYSTYKDKGYGFGISKSSLNTGSWKLYEANLNLCFPLKRICVLDIYPETKRLMLSYADISDKDKWIEYRITVN